VRDKLIGVKILRAARHSENRTRSPENRIAEGAAEGVRPLTATCGSLTISNSDATVQYVRSAEGV